MVRIEKRLMANYLDNLENLLFEKEEEPVCPDCGKPASECECSDKEDKKDKNEDKETKEAAEIVSNITDEILDESDEDIISDEEMTEAADVNLNTVAFAHRKSNQILASYRRAIGSRKYADAKNLASQLTEVYKAAYGGIDQSDINSNPRAFRKYRGTVISMTKQMILSISKGLTGFTKVKGSEQRRTITEKTIISLNGEINNLRKAKPEVLYDTLKSAVNALMSSVKVLTDNASFFSSLAATASKKAEEEVAESVKEVTDNIYNNMRKSIYESCSNGEITVEERENLLRNLIYTRNLDIIESTDVSKCDDKNDRFNAVKKSIYERCANGEFTEELREELISIAYDKIFNETGDSIGDMTKPATSAIDKMGSNVTNNTASIDKSTSDVVKDLEKNAKPVLKDTTIGK